MSDEEQQTFYDELSLIAGIIEDLYGNVYVVYVDGDSELVNPPW